MFLASNFTREMLQLKYVLRDRHFYTVKLDIATKARENCEQLGSGLVEIHADMILFSLNYSCLLAT